MPDRMGIAAAGVDFTADGYRARAPMGALALLRSHHLQFSIPRSRVQTRADALCLASWSFWIPLLLCYSFPTAAH
jgi:hypothetical protein